MQHKHSILYALILLGAATTCGGCATSAHQQHTTKGTSTPGKAPLPDPSKHDKNAGLRSLKNIPESDQYAFRAAPGPLRVCFDQAREQSPDATALIQTKISIQANGSVSSVRITKSNWPDPMFQKCVQDSLKDIKFTKHPPRTYTYNHSFPINYGWYKHRHESIKSPNLSSCILPEVMKEKKYSKSIITVKINSAGRPKEIEIQAEGVSNAAKKCLHDKLSNIQTPPFKKRNKILKQKRIIEFKFGKSSPKPKKGQPASPQPKRTPDNKTTPTAPAPRRAP